MKPTFKYNGVPVTSREMEIYIERFMDYKKHFYIKATHPLDIWGCFKTSKATGGRGR